jgi:hypothetical protein
LLKRGFRIFGGHLVERGVVGNVYKRIHGHSFA